MDRPQHRRIFLLVALALLVGGALLLLEPQWTSEPQRTLVEAESQRRPSVEQQPDEVEPAAIEATAPSAPSTPLAARSEPAVGFRGRVIDAVTRQPLREFEVQLRPVQHQGPGTNWLEPITRSFQSNSGRFAWSDIAAGNYAAAISAAGHQTFNVPEFRIDVSHPTHAIVAPLLHGFAVRGRVFERSTGAGIADAWISFEPIRNSEPMRSRASTKSKDDGSFVLDGVPGGEIMLTVGAQEHAFHQQPMVVDEKTPPQEIALSAGGTIRGMVTTTSGAPVKGRVWLNGPGPSYMDESNEAGQFTYKNLPPGRYRVAADTSAGGASEDVVLQQDELKDGIVLVVGAGRSIRGTVRGPRPDRVKETHLFLRTASGNSSMSTNADERGAYAFNGVPAGRATLSVYGAGLRFDKQVDVPSDQDVTLDIDLPIGARLSGRVTQNGKPLASRSVWMRPVENKAEILYRDTTTEEGQYEIEGLPPGDYFVRADEDISRRIAIAGDAVLNIDIPLVQLSGRVLEDGSSVPIVGADVYMRGTTPEIGRVRGDKQTNDFGQFSLTGIEPGEIMLMIYKPGYEMYREKITYSSPITNRTISLRKSSGVDVHVRAGSRRFPIGFTITQSFPGNDYLIDIWIPLDGERVGHVPSALAGTTFEIGRFSGKPLLFEDWDGQPFELQ